MKKIGTFLLNSVIQFGGYFLSSLLCIGVLQIVMRTFIKAESTGENLWKTLVMYAFMAATAVVFKAVIRSSDKAGYFAHMEGRESSLKETARSTLKNVDFWLCSAGFAIWAIIIPKAFGAINRLFLGAELYESFPLSILSVLTVSLPIMAFSFAAWVIVPRYWEKNRLHKS